jgi:hypothetical protein
VRQAQPLVTPACRVMRLAAAAAAAGPAKVQAAAQAAPVSKGQYMGSMQPLVPANHTNNINTNPEQRVGV